MALCLSPDQGQLTLAWFMTIIKWHYLNKPKGQNHEIPENWVKSWCQTRQKLAKKQSSKTIVYLYANSSHTGLDAHENWVACRSSSTRRKEERKATDLRHQDWNHKLQTGLLRGSLNKFCIHIDNDELDEWNLARFKLNSILTGINIFTQFEKMPQKLEPFV